MQASSITHNIIKSAYAGNNIHLLTDYSYSLFDNYMSCLDDILLFPINHNYSSQISYDLILSNNPIMFSTKKKDLSTLHLNSLLYFHSLCPNNFKKEDKFLLKNTITNCHKVFTNKLSMSSWGFDQGEDRCDIIKYGISLPVLKDNIKTRSVLVLNFSNNPSIANLFQYIKNIFADAVMITNLKDNKLIDYLRESIVCIESESVYNILNAIAYNCYVMSSLTDLSEDGLFYIKSYESSIEKIKELIKIYDIETAAKNRNTILNKYSDVTFRESFMKLIKKIKQEPYIWRE